MKKNRIRSNSAAGDFFEVLMIERMWEMGESTVQFKRIISQLENFRSELKNDHNIDPRFKKEL